MYKCKCCGKETLPVPPTDAIAFICPICWWENDVFTADENEPSDENHGLSLNQGRQNYKQYGICDPKLREPNGRASVVDAETPESDEQNKIIGGSDCPKKLILPKKDT